MPSLSALNETSREPLPINLYPAVLSNIKIPYTADVPLSVMSLTILLSPTSSILRAVAISVSLFLIAASVVLSVFFASSVALLRVKVVVSGL